MFSRVFYFISKASSSVHFGRFSWRTRTFHLCFTHFLKLSQSFFLSQTFPKFQSFANFPIVSFLKASHFLKCSVDLSQTFSSFHSFHRTFWGFPKISWLFISASSIE